MVQQQNEVHAEVRVAIEALDYEYNHNARTQSPRLSAARLWLAAGRRGFGPRDQEGQRTQRTSFVATYHTRVHTAAAAAATTAAVGHRRGGLGCLVEKNTT